VQGVGHGLAFVGDGIGHGAVRSVAFVFRIPGNALGLVTHASAVSIIRPSESEHEQVPIIDPASPALLVAQNALPAVPAPPAPANTATPASAAATPVPTTNDGPVWPLHGAITTQFGVPEPPYQAIHTGLDISDGQRPGVTPVKAFRRGKVIQVLRSGGLGNHVVVDHGNGVTSVYGHLASIAVQEGQEVDTSTTLGLEGTTGVSTGTHLHFEIRVNGEATDPHKFIPGQP
jgi:murein DD-endopeptidase MepM/ murein hydrolase activator NlpD